MDSLSVAARRIRRYAAVFAALLLFFSLTFSLAACGGGADRFSGLTEYTIDAAYNEATHSVSARQTVKYVNESEEKLDKVCFNLYGNAFREGAEYYPVRQDEREEVFPNGGSYGGMSINAVKAGGKAANFSVGGADRNVLTVPLTEPLYPTDNVELEIEFELKLANIYHRTGWTDKAVNLGNWYPIAAVREKGKFVCEPYHTNGDPFYSLIANYDITFSMPPAYMAASSGQTLGTVISAQTKTIRMAARGVRDFALVLSKRFQAVSGEADGIKVLYYYYADETPFESLKAATDAIKTYNKTFGRYPYPVFSVTQTTFNHGGMEYPNLVMISDRYSGEAFREIIIHETAHQWWYGVVGNNQVAHAWLDEGLTEYSTTLFFELNPAYGISKEDRILKAIQNLYIYTDLYKTVLRGYTPSMNRPSYEYADDIEYFYMTYVKGELLFDTLRSVLGDKAFFAGLRKYYEDNKYGVATPDDILGALESASGKDLGGVFKAWLEGSVVQ